MSHICRGLTLSGYLTIIGPKVVVSYVGVETFYIVAMLEIVDLARQFAAKTESTTFFPLALS